MLWLVSTAAPPVPQYFQGESGSVFSIIWLGGCRQQQGPTWAFSEQTLLS